ncbi:MAG: hypothetical protein ACREX4_16940, partial [Gammaproteobacteria bacterium]
MIKALGTIFSILVLGQSVSAGTVTLTGTTTAKYKATVPDGTIIDATMWTSTAVGTTNRAAVIN